VASADELPQAYRAYVADADFHPWLVTRFPEVRQPMLQAYLPEAVNEIHSLSGFADASGRILVLGARKILQWPRRLGIGVCFQAAPVPAVLRVWLRALCRRVGYHGVFEAEFIEAGGEYYLIDFNPRFYSQMAFDVARGLPFPLLAYEAALGENATWRRALRAGDPESTTDAYLHRLRFEVLMHGQRLSRRMTVDEVRRWRDWRSERRGRTVDAVLDGTDALPAVVDYLAFFYGWARHPRAALRMNLRGH
jgi:predicted ATP-grasp superfamily ATP-dependent carboligase